MISRRFRPYADALARTAAAPGELATVIEELDRFVEAQRLVPRLEAMALNPRIPVEVKRGLVEKVADALALGDLARRFLRLLLDHYRLGQIGDITAGLREQVRREAGIASASIVVASDPDDETVHRLRAAFERILHCEVEIDVAVDEQLLAGFVARVGSQLYDASLKGQLDRLASRLASA